MRAALPIQVVDLVNAFRDPLLQVEFLYLLEEAGILEPVQVDTESAARMVRPYAWFLERVGLAEGITLTSAGYLRPIDADAAVAELDLADEWGAKFSPEESQPVLDLRESATRLGLLREFHGMLRATPIGRKLRDDPIGLWWYLATHLPPARLSRPSAHASLLLLAFVATGSQAGHDPFEYVARMMWEAGWQGSDGTPIHAWQARGAAEHTYIPLVRLGALAQDLNGPIPDQPTGEGALFARAALLSWPG